MTPPVSDREKRFQLTSVAQTQAVGEALGKLVRHGDLLVLTGQLGAGKTTFTQGLGAGMQVREGIISPTFVLARIHPSEIKGPDLVHVDAYRLAEPHEVDTLDLEATAPTSVTVVEWGRHKVEHLSDSRLEIDLERAALPASHTSASWEFDDEDEGDEPRTLILRAIGPDWPPARWEETLQTIDTAITHTKALESEHE
ncbi:tRNA (adenosine(37)-N6)-threonylcarbamoyltransferase complex ATPase subunit type 1 TsaE [Glutamicibacter sp. MNS18]|uniref:tRNA (adenosine(37)-N6)-threonylcarbamoyltransferase complex ATPase subunit type 1 TsaE n=1 Tax=Glutamicibacter sp. MNS18 TaxID=2989817 RepID=UPI0022369DD1|nr:tRNA (adenosine(37)-N6)-threonylcarbamoyltransferase complex ATPase subunit type 1 TsaE [Glutamicibacter sp. MNS18]MCW4464200.1 tRNA (adenosine(37)-N6)-threonylcarbamoyltransferase complex ATPase subunit type 1 TsaE [Glutamicibacter sp. MNS18]